MLPFDNTVCVRAFLSGFLNAQNLYKQRVSIHIGFVVSGAVEYSTKYRTKRIVVMMTFMTNKFNEFNTLRAKLAATTATAAATNVSFWTAIQIKNMWKAFGKSTYKININALFVSIFCKSVLPSQFFSRICVWKEILLH